MTGESGRDPKNDWENTSRPTTKSTAAAQPLHYNTARHGSHVEESPELLRWRADLLMDEMMMGGVDVSAADSNRTFSGVDAPATQRPQPPANGGSQTIDRRSDSDHSGYANGEPYGDQRNGHSNGHESGYSNGAPSSTAGNGSYRPADPFRSSDRSSESNGSGAHGAGYPSPSSGGYRSSEPQRPIPPQNPEPRAYGARPAETPRNEPRSSEPTSRDDRPAPRPQSYEADDRRERSGYDRDFDRSYERDLRSSDLRSSDSAQGRFAPNGAPLESPSHAPRSYEEPPRPSPNYGGENRSEYGTYSGFDESQRETRTPHQGFDDKRDVDGGIERGAERAVEQDNRPVADEPPPISTLRTSMDNIPPRTSGERPYYVDEPYTPTRREPSANVPPSEPVRTPPPVRPPLPPVEPPRTPATAPRVTPPPVDEHTKWATAPDKWEYQDLSGGDASVEDDEPRLRDYPAPERRVSPENSAVRHDPAQFVSAMSVMGSNKKRSTLLPRSSELDIDTLHREISDLHGEIAALLPVGNETSERARHLLDKAYSILQSDPSRSAEVEYYMQQVRTIVQRLHQARQWSDLYRKRLHVYLMGWLGLSAMVLLARFLFQVDVEDALMWITGLTMDSWFMAHWATFVGTAAAGAFGGAVGALYTMQAHARGEYSFFDRKYGLRGLILPVMGLMVGAVGYWIFGIVFWLAGINPSESLTAAIVPTTAALAFGFSQESIFGTRD